MRFTNAFDFTLKEKFHFELDVFKVLHLKTFVFVILLIQFSIDEYDLDLDLKFKKKLK
jgi:hypothetical protein